MAENSVSILFVGDGFPVPLHSGLFTASPNPFGRFSRLLREEKRLPYAPTNSQFICSLRKADSLKFGMCCQNSRTSRPSLCSLLICMRRQTMEVISRKPRMISGLCPVRSMQTSVSR